MPQKQKNIKFLTIIGIIFILFIGKPEVGQSQKALSIGGNKWGIAFGNPVDYNGIRLNLIDLKIPKQINGLSISIKNESNIVNGIKLGIFNSPKGGYSHDTRGNTLYAQLNGIQVILLNLHGSNFQGFNFGAINKNIGGKGINICLLYSHASRINGISISPINIATWIDGIQVGLFNEINTWSRLGSCSEGGGGALGKCTGLQLAFCNYNEGEIYGLQIGVINYNKKATGINFGLINFCDSGQSVQFGIFNLRKNNRWFAKILPIVNFKWEKNKSK
jgi:hypothetical protein